ncbi:unnamed protein product, partial [Ectocarpus sp. 6 AP-2014]
LQHHQSTVDSRQALHDGLAVGVDGGHHRLAEDARGFEAHVVVVDRHVHLPAEATACSGEVDSRNGDAGAKSDLARRDQGLLPVEMNGEGTVSEARGCTCGASAL